MKLTVRRASRKRQVKNGLPSRVAPRARSASSTKKSPDWPGVSSLRRTTGGLARAISGKPRIPRIRRIKAENKRGQEYTPLAPTLLLYSSDPRLRALLVGGGFLVEQRHLAADHGVGHVVLALGLDVGQLELDVEHQLLDDAAQAAGAGVALLGPPGDLLQRQRAELQLRPLHLEQLL